VLEQVKRNFGDKRTIIKIDIDKSPQTANAYQIQGVPTLLLFRNGQLVWRKSGVMEAPLLTGFLNQHLG